MPIRMCNQLNNVIMATANVYLNFNGNCEEVFNFYKSVFGNDFTYLGRYKDMPPQEGMPPVSEGMGEKIMHVSLPLAEGSMLMGSDVGGGWTPELVQGNNFTISLTATSKAEADKLFAGLSDGGNVIMPMADTFWGDYYGMWTDKYGINWMVSFNENPPEK